MVDDGQSEGQTALSGDSVAESASEDDVSQETLQWTKYAIGVAVGFGVLGIIVGMLSVIVAVISVIVAVIALEQ